MLVLSRNIEQGFQITIPTKTGSAKIQTKVVDVNKFNETAKLWYSSDTGSGYMTVHLDQTLNVATIIKDQPFPLYELVLVGINSNNQVAIGIKADRSVQILRNELIK
jgi:sRNA-binding carbon storage regulator CsrA